MNVSIINLSTESVLRLQEHKKEGFRNLSTFAHNKNYLLIVAAKCLYHAFF